MECPSKAARLALALAVAAAAAATAIAVPPRGAAAQKQNYERGFVMLHNLARAEVGVGPVSWDDKVAAYAQSYAAKRQGDCAVLSSGGPYGENLYTAARGSAGGNASEAVASWVAEKQYYDHETNACSAPAGDSGCGHYTQVVWRDSTAIGCARVFCDNNAGVFIVCSYNPPGNVVGSSPY
ncbi:hypothetical protein BS78_02G025800 [Paspalum vaginatum]|nr:hypothetical protein BS78_02G025800 [Paspalum vaginatum]